MLAPRPTSLPAPRSHQPDFLASRSGRQPFRRWVHDATHTPADRRPVSSMLNVDPETSAAATTVPRVECSFVSQPVASRLLLTAVGPDKQYGEQSLLLVSPFSSFRLPMRPREARPRLRSGNTCPALIALNAPIPSGMTSHGIWLATVFDEAAQELLRAAEFLRSALSAFMAQLEEPARYLLPPPPSSSSLLSCTSSFASSFSSPVSSALSPRLML